MAGKTTQTKHQILTLTQTIIAESGYQSLSVRQVANQLGVTTGAFYKHFASKDALLLAVTQVISQELSDQARAAIAPDTTPFTALLTLGHVLMQHFIDRPRLMDFLFFNPNVANWSSEQSTDFPLLVLTQSLVSRLNATTPTTATDQQLFIQIWSFILGYGTLLKNQAVTFDNTFFRQTLTQLTGGNP